MTTSNIVFNRERLTGLADVSVSQTYQLSTLQGQNQINQVAQRLAVFYPGAMHSTHTIALAAASADPVSGVVTPHSWNTEPDMFFQTVQLFTSGKVTVLVTIENVVQRLIVNKLLVIDSPIEKLEIQNHSLQAPVNIKLSTLT